ncbi:MAG: hypothetical protein JWR10_1431 [Rubritepida sp.]|nr:hypothetical protein [Rubritepida sp.]
MKLESTEIPFSSADPIRNSSDVCTFFDPTNKYCIITAYLDGVNINHMCAGFCTTNGRIFKSKTLLMFDPNFGEFTVELTPTKMRAFMAAWIAQFGSYVSGRSGTATALKLVKLEVIRLENVVGKRGRSGAVSGR